MAGNASGTGCDIVADNTKVLALQEACRRSLIDSSTPVALLIDFTSAQENIAQLKRAFDEASGGKGRFLHTFAAKGNPLLGVLRFLHEQGLGVESASLGELTQALRSGAPPSHVVFDSPAKSWSELRFALRRGVLLNLDNFQELARVDTLVARGRSSAPNIGLRINPQVGAGTLKDLSTSQMTSKFGIGLRDREAELLQAYKARPWLRMVHVHVGSQGCPLTLIANGVREIVAFARKVNEAAGTQQITTIDIGGGCPVNFSSEEQTPTFSDYVAAIKAEAPELFTGEFLVLTEFGRAIFAKTGFFVTRVEYTKVCGGRPIVITQAGADLAVRTVYHPDKWPLRVTVHSPTGALKAGKLVEQDFAGPCCFAGVIHTHSLITLALTHSDILAHQRLAPEALPDDLIAVHDTGAYYHSSYSRYNARQAPVVYAYRRPGTAPSSYKFKLLKEAESVKDTLAFFTPKAKL